MKFVTTLLSIKDFSVLTLQSAPASGNYFEYLNYPSSIRYNNLCAKIFALYSLQNTSSTQKYILGIEVNVCMSQRQNINNTGGSIVFHETWHFSY